MKTPSRRGNPVNAARMRGWVDEFSGYRVAIGEGRIDRWLNQFAKRHRDTAARILDVVEFVNTQQIANAFRHALGRVPGWHANPARRKGRWRFVPFTASAGESGDTMLHAFRVANGMGRGAFNDLFIYKSDLPREGLGPKDTVVFVDDFAGTGVQAIENWNKKLAQLVPGNPSAYLVLVMAGTMAVREIARNTSLVVVPNSVLRDTDNFFNTKCRHFTPSEKREILRYCEKASPKEPRGFGDSGLVVVFPHRCPNNSLPVLHGSNKKWEGLFRRND